MKIKSIINRSFTFILKLPIYFYKGIISPLIPHSCKFYPTCSNYFLQALNYFGLKGFLIGCKRIFRCNPLSENHGYDPLPINIKGETRWLF